MRSLKLRFPDPGQKAPGTDLVFFFVGLIVFLVVFYQFKVSTEEIDYWNLRINYIESKKNRGKMKQIHPNLQGKRISQEISKEIKIANAILGEINFPWENLFNSIENAVSKDIALLSLLPNVSKRSLQIGGEARNMSELLAFVKALEQEEMFVNTHLLKYKINKNNLQQPVLFQISTSWNKVSS